MIHLSLLFVREWRLPGGGWESNVLDLTRFGIGLAERSLMNDSGALWRAVPDPDNPGSTISNSGYRFGIEAVGSDSDPDLLVNHGGAHENLRTLLLVYPNRDFGIAIMIPSQFADTWRFARRIRNHFGWNFSVDLSPRDRCDDDEAESDQQFLGVWRQSGDDVVVRRGYSHDAFLREYQFLREHGYYCADFEARVEEGSLRWDGVFKKGTGGEAIWRNFDFDGFNAKWNEMIDQGYRLIDLETYVVGGQRRWAGLFRPGSGAHALWRGFSTDDFATKREEMAASGRRLVDIEAYMTSEGLRWAGVWAEGDEGLLNRNYTRSEFLLLALQRADAGWVLSDVETYFVGGTQYFAGIWEQSADMSGIFDGDWCFLMEKHDELSADGYELLDLERW